MHGDASSGRAVDSKILWITVVLLGLTGLAAAGTVAATHDEVDFDNCEKREADTSNYVCNASTAPEDFELLDTAEGDVLSLGQDDTANKDLGFTFPWYDRAIHQINVSSNGYVCLTSSTPCDTDTIQKIPDPETPNDLVACSWTALDPSQEGAEVRYNETTTEDGTRAAVIDYDSVNLLRSDDSNTFQIQLLENGNTRCMLDTIHESADRDNNGVPDRNTSVGSENLDGTDGVRYKDKPFTVGTADNDPDQVRVAFGDALPAPESLDAQRGFQEITVTWDRPTDDDGNELSVDEYEVTIYYENGTVNRTETTEDTTFVDDELGDDETRTYEVAGVDDLGSGASAGPVEATTYGAPSEPTNILAEQGDKAGEADLTWDTPEDPNETEEYHTYYAEKAQIGGTCPEDPVLNETWDSGPDTTPPTTEATITQLDTGIEYCFTVTADNNVTDPGVDEGDPGASDGSKATDPPSEPQDIVADPGANAGEIKVTWAPPNDENGADTYHTHYIQRANLDADNCPADPTRDTIDSWTEGPSVDAPTTEATISDLGTDAEVYCVTVNATYQDYDGDPGASDGSVPAGPPGAPTDLTLTQVDGALTVDADWNAPDDDGGSKVTSYEVSWKNRNVTPDGETDTWDLEDDGSKEVSQTSTTVDVEDCTATYDVDVRAKNDHGWGAEATQSVPITGVCLPGPDGLETDRTDGDEITLTWNGLTEADSYEVWRCTEPDCPAVDEDVTLTDSTGDPSFVDEDLEADTTYCYQVNGLEQDDTSGYRSISACDTTASPPDAPENVLAGDDAEEGADRTDGTVNVTWEIPHEGYDDGGDPVHAFEITHTVNGGNAHTYENDTAEFEVAEGEDATTYTFSHEVNQTGLHEFEVRAVNDAGASEAAGVCDGTQTDACAVEVAGVPIPDVPVGAVLDELDEAADQVRDEDLRSALPFEAAKDAVCDAGDGTVDCKAKSAPAPPTLTVVPDPDDDRTVELMWDPPADTGSSEIAKYEINRSDKHRTINFMEDPEKVGEVDGDTTRFTDEDPRMPFDLNEWCVIAVNEDGLRSDNYTARTDNGFVDLVLSFTDFAGPEPHPGCETAVPYSDVPSAPEDLDRYQTDDEEDEEDVEQNYTDDRTVDGRVNLTWAPPSDRWEPDAYEVYRAVGDQDAELVGSAPEAATRDAPFIDRLDPSWCGEELTYTVKSVKTTPTPVGTIEADETENRTSLPNEDPLEFTPTRTAPSAPSGLDVEPGPDRGQVTVQWDAPEDLGCNDLEELQYKVYEDGDLIHTVDDTPPVNETFTPFAPGERDDCSEHDRSFSVRAYHPDAEDEGDNPDVRSPPAEDPSPPGGCPEVEDLRVEAGGELGSGQGARSLVWECSDGGGDEWTVETYHFEITYENEDGEEETDSSSAPPEEVEGPAGETCSYPVDEDNCSNGCRANVSAENQDREGPQTEVDVPATDLSIVGGGLQSVTSEGVFTLAVEYKDEDPPDDPTYCLQLSDDGRDTWTEEACEEPGEDEIEPGEAHEGTFEEALELDPDQRYDVRVERAGDSLVSTPRFFTTWSQPQEAPETVQVAKAPGLDLRLNVTWSADDAARGGLPQGHDDITVELIYDRQPLPDGDLDPSSDVLECWEGEDGDCHAAVDLDAASDYQNLTLRISNPLGPGPETDLDTGDWDTTTFGAPGAYVEAPQITVLNGDDEVLGNERIEITLDEMSYEEGTNDPPSDGDLPEELNVTVREIQLDGPENVINGTDGSTLDASGSVVLENDVPCDLELEYVIQTEWNGSLEPAPAAEIAEGPRSPTTDTIGPFPCPIPDAVQGLDARGGPGDGEVTLAWTPPADVDADKHSELGYQIKRSLTTVEACFQPDDEDASAPSYTFDPPEIGSGDWDEYHVRASVADEDGCGKFGPKATASARTANAEQPLKPPEGVEAFKDGDWVGEIRVEWQPPLKRDYNPDTGFFDETPPEDGPAPDPEKYIIRVHAPGVEDDQGLDNGTYTECHVPAMGDTATGNYTADLSRTYSTICEAPSELQSCYEEGRPAPADVEDAVDPQQSCSEYEVTVRGVGLESETEGEGGVATGEPTGQEKRALIEVDEEHNATHIALNRSQELSTHVHLNESNGSATIAADCERHTNEDWRSNHTECLVERTDSDEFVCSDEDDDECTNTLELDGDRVRDDFVPILQDNWPANGTYYVDVREDEGEVCAGWEGRDAGTTPLAAEREECIPP